MGRNDCTFKWDREFPECIACREENGEVGVRVHGDGDDWCGSGGGVLGLGLQEPNADVVRGKALDSTWNMYPPAIVMWPIFSRGAQGPSHRGGR